MTTRNDIKKSKFVAVTDSETNDTFDFVRNGQNLRIYQSDLIAALGLTGELQSLGEVAAVPVLYVNAGINYIRNLLGVRGVSASLSAQNGVEIGHNFTVDNTGVPIMINSDADSPTFRSIQGSGGVNVAGAAGVLQISLTETPESTKTVNIYTIDDFLNNATSVVGDLITLEPETEYRVLNDISSSYRYQLSNNTVLSSEDAALIELEYTGAGTMLTVVDANIKIKQIQLNASSGTMFNVSSTTGFHECKVCNVEIFCDTAGTLDNLGLVFFNNVDFAEIYTQGLTLTNNFAAVIFNILGATIASGSGNLIDFGTSVVTYFILDKGIFNINSTGYILSGLANSGNIATGGLGLVTNSRNFGTGADPPTNNISPFDDRWESQHNSTIEDSINAMLATHAGGATTIAISAAGLANAVQVTGVWTSQTEYRFTGSADGTWTYNGNQTYAEVAIHVSASIFVGTDLIAFLLYKNGVAITDSVVYGTAHDNEAHGMTLIWGLDLQNSDYLQLYCANMDTNVDIEIESATVRIIS